MDPLAQWALSAVIALVPSIFTAWVAVRSLRHNKLALDQKVDVDTITDLRAQLRDCRSQIAELREEHEQCQEALRDMRAKYEDDTEMLRSENLLLMRKALGLQA